MSSIGKAAAATQRVGNQDWRKTPELPCLSLNTAALSHSNFSLGAIWDCAPVRIWDIGRPVTGA